MTTTQIEKLLELINKNDIINAKQLLQIELLKNSNNKNVKLIDVIKKYFNKMDNSRPVLKTIMIKNNKQFICNGYSMYIFESYIDELDILTQSTDNVLDEIEFEKSKSVKITLTKFEIMQLIKFYAELKDSLYS